MRNIFLFLLLLVTASCGSNDHYTDLAKDIASKVPQGSRIAIKITSPEKNGLPEVFLQKLMAEFSGALVKVGDSKFEVLSRNSTEEIWKEAIEFNNQDVDKIASSAEADISIVLSPKINEGGIDLSVTAYSLREGSTGNILSSTNKLIPMNVKAELGVDVQNLDKKIDQLGQLLDKKNSLETNELDRLFVNFANHVSISEFINTYNTGCESPITLRKKWENYFKSPQFKENRCLFSDSSDCQETYEQDFLSNFNQEGFYFKCEVYDNGKNLVENNVLMVKQVDIEVQNFGNFTFPPDQVSISNCCGIMNIPAIIKPYAKLLKYPKEETTGYDPTTIEKYAISLPQKTKYFITVVNTCTSRGCDSSMRMFYDEKYLSSD